MPLAEKPDIDALVKLRDTDKLLMILYRMEDGEQQMQVARALIGDISGILASVERQVKKLVIILGRALASDARALARDLFFDLIHARALTRAFVHAFDIQAIDAIAHVRILADTLGNVRDRPFVIAVARDLTNVDARALAHDILLNLDRARALARDLARAARARDAESTYEDEIAGVAESSLASDVMEHHQEVLEATSLTGDRSGVVEMLIFLGDDLARQGVVDPAIMYYEEALGESADILRKEQTQQVQTSLEALKEYRRSSNYLTSIKHPRRLSKRLSSRFKIFIYPSEDRAEVEKVLREAFDDEEWTGSVHPSGVETGDLVVLKLWSADIEFSGEVVKRIEHVVNQVTIGAKPKDTCHPGDHTVTLSISKKDTGEEISSVDFTVQVVDFAFDHVSRPLLSNVVSAVSGVFGAAAFAFSLFTDIDKTLGLTAGTAALAVAAFIQARVWQLFRRPSTTVTPYPP